MKQTQHLQYHNRMSKHLSPNLLPISIMLTHPAGLALSQARLIMLRERHQRQQCAGSSMGDTDSSRSISSRASRTSLTINRMKELLRTSRDRLVHIPSPGWSASSRQEVGKVLYSNKVCTHDLGPTQTSLIRSCTCDKLPTVDILKFFEANPRFRSTDNKVYQSSPG